MEEAFARLIKNAVVLLHMLIDDR